MLPRFSAIHFMIYRGTLLLLALVLGACRNAPDEPQGKDLRTDTQTQEAPPAGPPPQVTDPTKWNYPEVGWTTDEAGRNRMRKSGRPGLVVLQGDWCPQCRNLATVFSDPEVERLSDSFELILIDSDTAEANAYEGTGKYVPRTIFLRPDGSIDDSLTAPDARFPHFFSLRDKAALTQAMKTAISRYGS